MSDSLATTDDLAARLGVTFTTDQLSRAQALLDDASAEVRSYTRQTLSAVTGDVAYLDPTFEQWLFLPQRPVTAVSSVVVGGASLVEGMWTLQGDAIWRLYGWNWRMWVANGPWGQPDTITVTYDHGYDVIPADIVRVVCKLAASSWANPQGLREWRQGETTVTLSNETVGTGALDDGDKATLDRYRLRQRSTRLSAAIL